MQAKTRDNWRRDYSWALQLQPEAIEQFYRPLWPGCEVVEIDRWRGDRLRQAIDVGGADKMVRLPSGGLVFLAQRFRRYESYKRFNYDDMTIRHSRTNRQPTEWDKVCQALDEGGFMASVYATGHVDSSGQHFARFRIVRYREVIVGLRDGTIPAELQTNHDGLTKFWAINMVSIPRNLFLLDYRQ